MESLKFIRSSAALFVAFVFTALFFCFFIVLEAVLCFIDGSQGDDGI